VYINKDQLGELSLSSLRDSIAERITGMKDPATGKVLLSNVWPREAWYHGDLASNCPDLVFALDPAFVLAGGLGCKGSLVGPRTSHPLHHGSHRMEGILVASGPGIQQRHRPRSYRLEDITATVLAHLNVGVPAEMDGRPVVEALGTREWAVTSGTPQDTSDGKRESTGWATEAEMVVVIDRLRGIGYLE
jgi:predicted AlkP superfamily phosphohydrolase/phosphomutase